MNKIHKIYQFFICAPLEEKKKILYISALSFRVFIIIRFIPLRKYFYSYFNTKNDKPINLEPYKKDICLIKRVLKNLPIRHICLNESIIVHLYLKRIGIIVPIFLGIAKNSGINAHAWYYSSEENNFNQFIIRDAAKREKRKKRVG